MKVILKSPWFIIIDANMTQFIRAYPDNPVFEGQRDLAEEDGMVEISSSCDE